MSHVNESTSAIQVHMPLENRLYASAYDCAGAGTGLQCDQQLSNGKEWAEGHLADFALQEHFGRQVRKGRVALGRGKSAGVQLPQNSVVRHLGPEAIGRPLQAAMPHQKTYRTLPATPDWYYRSNSPTDEKGPRLMTSSLMCKCIVQPGSGQEVQLDKRAYKAHVALDAVLDVGRYDPSH